MKRPNQESPMNFRQKIEFKNSTNVSNATPVAADINQIKSLDTITNHLSIKDSLKLNPKGK